MITKQNKARVLIRLPDGAIHTEYMENDVLAYWLWSALSFTHRVAFRSAHDQTPVESWDFVLAETEEENGLSW